MISKLKLVSLSTNSENLDKLLNNFVSFSGFHPVDSSKIVSTVHGARAFETQNPCESLLGELNEIEKLVNITFESKKVACFVSKIDDIQIFIENSHNRITEKYNQMKSIEKDVVAYKEALLQVQNIENMSVPFDDLFNAKFVALRFGKIPNDMLERLRFYDKKPFVFMPFVEKNNETWCLYLTTNEYKTEIDNIFTSMFFNRIHIPDFVHGTPDKASETLSAHIQEQEQLLSNLKTELTIFAQENIAHFNEIKGQLEFLSDIFYSRQYFVRLGERLLLMGFIEQSQVKRFKQHFEIVPNVEIQVQDAEADTRFQPPTKLKNNWFTSPFQFFVEMYGVPSYHDVDPTTMVAITYSLLFGIMFGDFGQGILLAIIGLIMTKFTKNALAPILSRIGISSAFFGVIYGETFGNSTFLEPFYHWLSSIFNVGIHPLHVMDNSVTMNLLIGTVAIGAIIILTIIFINTLSQFKNKHYGKALFSANGVSGLMLYGFVLVGIFLQMGLGMSNVFNPITIILFIVLPIILIFLSEPLERKIKHQPMFPDGVGGFIIEGFFELFEVILSYVTNTLSFLRVGGFVLSHAGMMLVVATLMNMAGGNGSILVAILGNLFVMGLEGLIVGIQVLRLEFYEMFSRYFEGDGIVFNPRF